MSLIFWFSSVPSSLNKHTLATSTNGQSVAFIEHILKNKPFWNGEQQKGSVSGNSFPVSFPSCAIIINDAAGPFRFASFTCTKKERTKERKKERKKERTKKRKNERKKERTKERTKERKNERKKETTNEKRKNKRKKERKRERTNERKNEREVIGRSVFIAGKKCERNGRVLPR